VIFAEAEEGGFIVTVKEFPEIATQGNTHAEALKNAAEAIELCLMEEHGSATATPKLETIRLEYAV